jgi:hypothetical protein
MYKSKGITAENLNGHQTCRYKWRNIIKPLCWMFTKHHTLMCMVWTQEGPIAYCRLYRYIWEWTRNRVAIMLRTESRHISAGWTLHSSLHTWPPQRQRAILWTLAHLVYYRMRGRRRQSLLDYIDYLRRARWKAYGTRHRMKQVGNYLAVL